MRPPHHGGRGGWDRGTGWRPLFPLDAADAVDVHVLPQLPDGRRVLDLVMPEGPVRWAVLLPEALRWPDPWPELRTALYEGRVPVASVEIRSGTAGHG